MSITEVAVAADGGPVCLRVAEHGRGHGVVSVVWRFAGVALREGMVGEISRDLRRCHSAPRSAVDGKGFLVDGFVVPVADQPPAPYQVLVTLLQDGREVHKAVPVDCGTGTISPDEVRFRYPFVLTAR
jgi:hypothetical protein